jgi:ribosomal protein L25 (general stress protein Ctc)
MFNGRITINGELRRKNQIPGKAYGQGKRRIQAA